VQAIFLHKTCIKQALAKHFYEIELSSTLLSVETSVGTIFTHLLTMKTKKPENMIKETERLETSKLESVSDKILALL